MAVARSTWSPSSWREHDAAQQPDWPSGERVEAVRAQLAAMPPLVFAGEARGLRDALATVAEGRALLSPTHLRVLVPDLDERDVYVCGPPAMTAAVEASLRQAGLPRRQIRVERFAL